MREILFRGKRVDNGEWETSYNPNATMFCGVERADFDQKTVGQYTGLTDKNGKKIFEGDIVEGHCHSAWNHDLMRGEVAYGRNGFETRHYVKCGNERSYFTYKVLFSKDVVVIGNIHDNPELLEVEHDTK